MSVATERSSRSFLVPYLVIGFVCVVVAILVIPATRSNRGKPRTYPLNRIRTQGLAVHNVAMSQDGYLPPRVGEEGSVGFYAALLSSLEHGDVYDMIDPSVPWTDPKNRRAYGTRIPTFEWPKDYKPYYDNSPTAEGYAVVYSSPNSRLVSPGKPSWRIDDIAEADGTGSTLLLGSIDDTRVPAWGDPSNVRDPALGFRGGAYAFGGLKGGAALVVFCDGHARSLSKDIDPAVAKALATPDGGDEFLVEDY